MAVLGGKHRREHKTFSGDRALDARGGFGRRNDDETRRGAAKDVQVLGQRLRSCKIGHIDARIPQIVTQRPAQPVIVNDCAIGIAAQVICHTVKAIVRPVVTADGNCALRCLRRRDTHEHGDHSHGHESSRARRTKPPCQLARQQVPQPSNEQAHHRHKPKDVAIPHRECQQPMEHKIAQRKCDQHQIERSRLRPRATSQVINQQ
jgi:hypothetical protein